MSSQRETLEQVKVEAERITLSRLAEDLRANSAQEAPAEDAKKAAKKEDK